MKAAIHIKYYLDCQNAVFVLDDKIELTELKTGEPVTREIVEEVVSALKEEVSKLVGKSASGNMIFGTKYIDVSKLVACDVYVKFDEEETT